MIPGTVKRIRRIITEEPTWNGIYTIISEMWYHEQVLIIENLHGT